MYIAEDLIIGGMETSATLIRWAIILLTNHVDIQERLHVEIDSVVGRERIPTLEDRAKSVDKNSECWNNCDLIDHYRD